MNSKQLESANRYKIINELALKGEIVILGSSYMAEFPFYELCNRNNFEHAVYNRSIQKLTIAEAQQYISEFVLELFPSKLFIQLGEDEFEDPNAIATYSKLIKTIKNTLPNTKIYLITLPTERAQIFNQKLCKLALTESVGVIKLSDPSESYTSVFNKLAPHFREFCIDFQSALSK